MSTGPAPRPPADYHVHSRFSDGEDGLAACVERALELGLPEIGFAEHLTPDVMGDEACLGPDGVADYVAAVRAVAGRYPGVRVLCGIEVDYVPGASAEVLDALSAHAFDFAFASVHFVDRFSFDEEAGLGQDGWRDEDRLWRRYYQTVAEAAATRAFRVLAHLDLPKKWGSRPGDGVTVWEARALAAAARAGMAIELNTSGRERHPVGEAYPSPALLRRARAAGLPVLFGSDAHRAADIGAGFASAAGVAREAGYTSWQRLSDDAAVRLE